MMQFTVKRVTAFSVAAFLNDALRQLKIYEIFDITNSTNL